MKIPTLESVEFRQLRRQDLSLYRELQQLMDGAFEVEREASFAPPDDTYLTHLLDSPLRIVLVGLISGQVVGGLVAYHLEKFFPNESEIYLYDIAVQLEHRRKGIARALIQELRKKGQVLGVATVYVQADPSDTPAVQLYRTLGIESRPLHFDIAVSPQS